MPKTICFSILFLLLTGVVGCSDSDNGVIGVEGDNLQMNDAIAFAKANFDYFEKNWKTLPSDDLAVKFRMEFDDDGVEHIWFTPLSISGDKITALCANDPVNIPGLKMGDQRTFSKSEISDWMILDGVKCHGGYTIQVMTQLAPDQAPPFEFVGPSNDN